MMHVRRMGVLSLVACCAAVLSGCNDDGSGQSDTTSVDKTSVSITIVNGAGRVNGIEADSPPDIAVLSPEFVIRVVVPAPDEAVVPPAVLDYGARIVEVMFPSVVAQMPKDEFGAARARAFGLEWGGRTHEEINSLLHCKSQVRGCSYSYGTRYYNPVINGPSSSATERGYLDEGEKTPYAVSREYLGSRDGKDHFLVTLIVSTTTSVSPAEADLLEAEASWFNLVQKERSADGLIDVTCIRDLTYEVVYSDEPFFLKLADRMLFGFGVPDREKTAEYTPCPFCALSDEMVVDELRLASAVIPATAAFASDAAVVASTFSVAAPSAAAPR